MNVKEENICRLCLNVAENGFEIIDEITRKIFEVLLLRVNLDISKDPIICRDCADVMVKSFNFKSAFISTEELVVCFAIEKNRATFEMKDVYTKDGKNIESLDDNFICRFCSNHLSASNFVLLDTLMNDVKFAEMLQLLMPDMDFNVIKNPVICTSCRQDLECYNKFVENCLGVEEKITSYFQSEGTPSSGQVKLSEILRFLNKNIFELDYTQIRTIKQEEDTLEDVGETRSEVYDSELIKAEEALDIKDEELNSSEIACRTLSNTPAYTLNVPCGLKTHIGKAGEASTTTRYGKCMCDTIQDCCIECDMQSNMISSEKGKAKLYQTECKGEFNKKTSWKNILKAIHKGIREVEMYKCSMCSFQTKQKGNLKVHMLIHKDITEVEMYKCSKCAYLTKRKGNLKIHMLIHKDIAEIEVYKCSMCTYKTRRKTNLKRHTLIHKDITEVEIFKCAICTYHSKQKNHLKKHMLIHKDITEVEMYKCSVCTYQAKYKSSLKTHMLIHKDITEVEMYKCSKCAYETKRKKSIESHMLTHKDITEMEMYKCSMCTYKSKHKGYFKMHLLNHKSILVHQRKNK